MSPDERRARDAGEGPDADPAPSRVVVIACGEPLRGDDSVAHRAVRELSELSRDGVEVRVVGGLQPEHLVALPEDTAVVIVDAVVGVPPGDVVELGLAALESRAARVVAASTHQLPLDRVVALAQLLRDVPVSGRFVGLGIADVRPGADLGAGTRAALPALRAAVERAVREVAGG